MISVFKKGGAWKTKSGKKYTIKSIHLNEKDFYITKGWHLNLESALGKKDKNPDQDQSEVKANDSDKG